MKWITFFKINFWKAQRKASMKSYNFEGKNSFKILMKSKEKNNGNADGISMHFLCIFL